MVFNSATFLLFFIVVYFLYWLINNKLKVGYRNGFTIVASYVFYGWWDWRFLSLIAFSSIADYFLGILLNRQSVRFKRRIILSTSIFINIGILGFFKYFNFFIDSLNQALSLTSFSFSTNTLNIILPVGISFYTFQTLSYTIDIYKKKISPTKDILSFLAFVSFFPQLVAGPIERASHLLKQFQYKKTFNYNQNISGLRLVLWGFFKKVVIADNFGVLADSCFNIETPISGLTTTLGALFFAFQIYADFSGYSDIAIGIARMMGFDLMTNFKTPYFSRSFSEFWRRWHISLSTWFRDYLYIPLGGNKVKSYRIYLNIFITFLVSGLWHGANFTFIIWGALHGLVLLIEKRFNIKGSAFYGILVFVGAVLFWIPFRAENYTHFIDLLGSLLDINAYNYLYIRNIIENFASMRFIYLMLIFIVFILIEFSMKTKAFDEWIGCKPKLNRVGIYYVLILIILLMGNFSVKPSFIYFQF